MALFPPPHFHPWGIFTNMALSSTEQFLRQLWVIKSKQTKMHVALPFFLEVNANGKTQDINSCREMLLWIHNLSENTTSPSGTQNVLSEPWQTIIREPRGLASQRPVCLLLGDSQAWAWRVGFPWGFSCFCATQGERAAGRQSAGCPPAKLLLRLCGSGRERWGARLLWGAATPQGYSGV